MNPRRTPTIYVHNVSEAADKITTHPLPLQIRISNNVSIRAFMHMLNVRRLGVRLSDANYETAKVIYVRSAD